MATVEDAECPEVVRSEESAAVGLRNLVTQWHITQKGALPCILRLSKLLAALVALHGPSLAALQEACSPEGA